MATLRDHFEAALQTTFPHLVINGRASPRLPHTSNMAFVGHDRQAFFMALDMAGLYCSTGSACASGSSEPSPTLLAMQLPKSIVESSLRFSLGPTTAAEIDEALRRISQVIRGQHSLTYHPPSADSSTTIARLHFPPISAEKTRLFLEPATCQSFGKFRPPMGTGNSLILIEFGFRFERIFLPGLWAFFAGARPVIAMDGAVFSHDVFAITRHGMAVPIRSNRSPRQHPTSNKFASDNFINDAKFIVGPENRLTAATIISLVNGDPAWFSPLVLHGPSGTGKSHLARASLNRDPTLFTPLLMN